MRRKHAQDGIKLQGFARLQICEYGPNGEPNHKIVSDTGIIGPNQKTNIGFLNYLCYMIGASAGSLAVGFAAVGTGGTPASNAGSLTGETMARKATTLSINGSTQLQWIASWASSDCTGSCTIGNAGLFNHSSQQSLAWGISTPGQTWSTNQSLNLTYQLSLS
jgi:hypothetical protein